MLVSDICSSQGHMRNVNFILVSTVWLNISPYLVHSRVEISQNDLHALRFVVKLMNEIKQLNSQTTLLLEGETLASWLKLSAEKQQDYKLSKEKFTKKPTPL